MSFLPVSRSISSHSGLDKLGKCFNSTVEQNQLMFCQDTLQSKYFLKTFIVLHFCLIASGVTTHSTVECILKQSQTESRLYSIGSKYTILSPKVERPFKKTFSLRINIEVVKEECSREELQYKQALPTENLVFETQQVEKTLSVLIESKGGSFL